MDALPLILPTAALKQATHELHRKLDRASGMTRLMARDLKRAEYVNVLQTLQGIYAGIEPKMQAAERLVGKIATWDCKADWLACDLRHLQHEQGAVAASSVPQSIQERGSLPSIDTLAKLAGCLYVLEGSTLGGRVISARLRSNASLQADGALRFFSAYGDQTPLRWSACCAAIDACLPQEELCHEACTAARAVFELFIARFETKESVL